MKLNGYTSYVVRDLVRSHLDRKAKVVDGNIHYRTFEKVRGKKRAPTMHIIPKDEATRIFTDLYGTPYWR